ncbi:MAG TPA: glycosyl hydrolase [Caulobacteraceae bacterium]|nr:glycosyl hydrolase [Caulobacteraceae bacterium]
MSELSPAWFADPPLRYRPAATVTVGLTPAEDIPAQLQAVVDGGFGALMIAPGGKRAETDPVSTRDPTIQRVIRAARALRRPGGEPDPLPDVGECGSGPPPDYLGEEYFRRYAAALAFAKAHGMTAILYDELGYPTGGAGGGRIDPANYRKLLVRSRLEAAPGGDVFAAPSGALLAAVAVNGATKARLDLTAQVTGGALNWSAPGPGWSVQFFTLQTAAPQGGAQDYYAVADYFDPEAVSEFIDVTYEAYARHVGDYFGDTITTSFFDDVGIYSCERTWAAGLDARFEARTGRKAATYYPALWEDIGPETAPARIAFFAARAEALGEGFPELVSRWGERHGLQASGHSPGQYEIQPTDMNGDPFKFYRAQPVPMIDVIFVYGFGRDGFKLTTSAADVMDKPVVLAEQFTTSGTPTGYRRAMDSLVRGVNSLITCTTSTVGGPTDFADYVGRASMLLRGGRRVADIGIVYPIASLQAFYRFDAPDNQEGPLGRYAPQSADYLAVGDRLTGDLHRDFTFIHPDDLASDHLKIGPGTLTLDNAVNRQVYRVMILPGGEVFGLAALQKLKTFWDAGGAVIATTELPTKSAAFDEDGEVRALVEAMFGQPGEVRRNPAGGATLFIPDPDIGALKAALDRLGPPADVGFSGDPHPGSGNGQLAYIHKVKDGGDIVFVANSSEEAVETTISLRGAFELELRDPHTGATGAAAGARIVGSGERARTEVRVSLDGGRSLFLIGWPKRVGD